MMLAEPNNDWHDRFVAESDVNARLRMELEDARAKYDSLLEASLQQMASRIDEFNVTNNKNRHSPTQIGLTPSNPSPVNNSSAQANSNLNGSGSLAIPSDEASHTSSAVSSNVNASDKKTNVSAAANMAAITPIKKKKGLVGLLSGKGSKGDSKGKDKDGKGGVYNGMEVEPPGSEFSLPIGGPSTSYQHLPRLGVCPLSTRNHVIISGPNGPVGPVVEDESGSAHFSDIVAGRSISTYPHIPGNPNRDGDPIADRFSAHVYENRVIASIADGCNWGVKPREAAVKANAAFVEYVNLMHDSITDVKKAGHVLLNAFEYAHNSIMEGKLAFWDAGTTTLLGGVLLEINKTDKFTPQWEFVCASVGDCKAFCYHDGEISDITQGNRQNASDPRDCGGRLGPHLDEGKPDLRNLNLFCAPCEDGDLIIIVTDGIHDNLDPQHLGRVPKDMPKEFNLTGDKWDDLDPAKAIYAKNAYITELLLRLLKTGEETPTPKQVADRLVAHCIQVTQKSREYMESNQGKRLPEDYVEFPGKMDHTTCLCFRVGRFPSLPEKSVITSGSASTQITRTAEDDGQSPRVMGSPFISMSPKFDNWQKISPSIKHN